MTPEILWYVCTIIYDWLPVNVGILYTYSNDSLRPSHLQIQLT